MEIDREICKYLTGQAPSQKSLYEYLESLSEAQLQHVQSILNWIPSKSIYTKVLEFLKEKQIITPAHPNFPPLISYFIPLESTKSLIDDTRFPNASEKNLYEILIQEIFLRQNRIPHHEHLMAHFPIYLERHIEVMKIVFDDRDLNVSCVWRYYIAYMAAATHKCEYLMKLEEFLCKRFHQEWFDCTSEVPEKLLSLNKANVKLAHRPWEFSESDLKSLLIHWNSNELVLALTILCQFHCLSGFIFGTGVAPEEDLPLSTFKEPIGICTHLEKPKSNVVEVLRVYSEPQEFNDYSSDSAEELHEDVEDIYFSRIAGGYLNYINYPMDTIERPFNASDFKFADQAYYTLEKIIPEVSESIWNRIRTTFAMTYEHLGLDSGVETGPLRRAFWNYVQRVYGLQYDDYDYTDINNFLSINTKRYIKKVACFPETVTKQDYLNIELDITHDEMIHLNLIICEARFEAQMVYMLHVVQRVLDLG